MKIIRLGLLAVALSATVCAVPLIDARINFDYNRSIPGLTCTKTEHNNLGTGSANISCNSNYGFGSVGADYHYGAGMFLLKTYGYEIEFGDPPIDLMVNATLSVKTAAIIRGGHGAGIAHFELDGQGGIPLTTINGTPCRSCDIPFEFNREFRITYLGRTSYNGYTQQGSGDFFARTTTVSNIRDLSGNPVSGAHLQFDTPEPATYAMILTGIGFGAIGLRRRFAQSSSRRCAIDIQRFR